MLLAQVFVLMLFVTLSINAGGSRMVIENTATPLSALMFIIGLLVTCVRVMPRIECFNIERSNNHPWTQFFYCLTITALATTSYLLTGRGEFIGVALLIISLIISVKVELPIRRFGAERKTS